MLTPTLWNKHTTSDGLGAVLVIMISGIFYEQAPLRQKVKGGESSTPASSKAPDFKL